MTSLQLRHSGPGGGQPGERRRQPLGQQAQRLLPQRLEGRGVDGLVAEGYCFWVGIQHCRK